MGKKQREEVNSRQRCEVLGAEGRLRRCGTSWEEALEGRRVGVREQVRLAAGAAAGGVATEAF